MTVEIRVQALEQRLQTVEFELAKALEYIDELKGRDRKAYLAELKAEGKCECGMCNEVYHIYEMINAPYGDDQTCMDCWDAYKKENERSRA